MATLKKLLGDKWEEGIRVKWKEWDGDFFEPRFQDKSTRLYWGLDQGGKIFSQCENSENWEIIKPTKKITLYKYIYSQDVWMHETVYSTKSFADWGLTDAELFKTETKEIKIDES